MGYYPIFVEMSGRRVLLVGGGHVALEKIGKLVESEADVTVVAPELIPEVRAFIEDGRARLLERQFEDGDTAGADLVFVATDNGAINRRVADEARARGLWVNAADDVANCDFILPGVASSGHITIATSTGGSSPALARWLRERMEAFLGTEVVALGDVLAELRVRARARDRECASGCDRTQPPPPLLCKTCPNRIPPDAWQRAIDDEVLALLRAGNREAASARIASAIGLDQPLLARA
ncbi:MAG: bifunctional precorrin-2 dehydrogenase/sirohydrochlorin ferrochelatase [Dehalococcoidia bacterium]|nr:bifunctional precorrin-2 dehydrogenase/sirohydrochlorin ferrochelatase [Dehalococcoidia bacterium]